MTLVAAEGLLSKIMKAAEQDPVGTAELVRYALAESLADQIDAVRPQLEQDIAKAMADEADDARRALVRSYVAARVDGRDVGAYRAAAQHLAVVDAYVAKAWTGFGSKPGERDERGRFKTRFGGHPDTDRSRNSRSAEYANFLRQAKQSGAVADDATVHIRGRHKDTGPRPSADWTSDEYVISRKLNGQGDNHPQALPEGFVPLQASIDPRGIKGGAKGLAALDLMSGFTSPEQAGRLAGVFGDTAAVNTGLGSYAGARERGDRYAMIAATGRGLSSVSTPGSPGHVLGGLAQLVGEIGPEAERVLEPGVRRTAYRYRGTEQRPPKELVADVKGVDEGWARNVLTAPEEARQGRIRANEGARGSRGQNLGGSTAGDVVSGTEAFYSRPRGIDSVQALTMQARGDVAASHLAARLPDMRLAELSREAGRIPPSQGILIDADGDVVADSVGFNGDHYLPFDLRNLADLRGGQYVRTRTAGGLTGEDIYTGLMSNARQVQVVSNSGVFTLELDPDLRGGRRYSDKARQMVGRYQQILGAVADERRAPMLQDIAPQEKRRIREQALDEVGAGDRAAFDDRVRQLTDEARFRATVEGPDDDEIEEAARNEAQAEARQVREHTGRPPTRTEMAQLVDDKRRGIVARERESRVRQLQLDGEGYAAAMQALQGEFPHLIRRVHFETLPDFMRARNLRPAGGRDFPKQSVGRDRGYVRPGANSPFESRRSVSRETTGAGETAAPAGQAASSTRIAGGSAAGAARAVDHGVKTVARVTPFDFPLQPTRSWSEATAAGAERAKRELGNRLSGVLLNAAALPGLAPAADTTPEEALSLDTAGYSLWITSKYRDADRLAGFLTDPANSEHLDKVSDVLEAIPAELDDVDEGDRRRLAGALSEETLRSTRSVVDRVKQAGGSPFAAPAEAPAFAVPTSRNPKPQPYADIVALGAAPEPYEKYLKAATTAGGAQAGFVKAVDTLAGMSARDRADAVASAAQQLADIRDYGRALESGEYAVKPQGVEISEADARKFASNPQESPHYRRVDNLQAAWAFVTAREVAGSLSGGGPSPKAPEPEQRQPEGQPVRRPFGKRRVLLYPLGSPLASALAKRLR